jgi:uncharacterized coiled-coil protein SlyX
MSEQRGKPDPVDERLVRLEEGHAYAEHTVEQINGEVAELNRRLGVLLQRIERIERRFEALAEEEDEIVDM